jgi:hypothetical protein
MDAFIAERIIVTKTATEGRKGRWVTKGRLEVLVGKDECQEKMANNEYIMQLDADGKPEYFYSEGIEDELRTYPIHWLRGCI